MVFLVLAAQYESWSLPLAVILVVPMCLLSAIAGVKIASEDINIFTQIGFVVLVGLASKNAILIVEFAKYHRDAGESRRQATLEACRLRLRPIVMTSLAFILGVLPLLLGHGAGAEMRRTLGTTVFSGMLGVTLFGIFLTPVFFFVIDWLSEARVWTSPLVPLDRHLGRWGPLAPPCAAICSEAPASLPRRSRSPRSCPSPTPDRVPEPEPETRTRAAEVRRASVSRFFIDRPIFASVLSIIITLPAGHRGLHPADRAVSRDHAADGRGRRRSIPAPTPRWLPTPSPRRSSSRSTASRTCSTCRRNAPTTATTR